MRLRSLAAAGLCALLAAGAAPSARALSTLNPGSADASSLGLPDGPASLRGLADDASLSVFTGQIAYEIPFDLPAGPGGFVPDLTLTYDGALGNGLAGIGWALTVPEIRRSTRLGVPTYTSADELELVGIGGGGRLVPAGDGTFRVEGLGQGVKIAFAPQMAGAVVTDGDGIRYLMGWSSASRVYEGARTRAWKVQQIIHPSGQSIGFTWSRDQGHLQLDRVSWGPSGAYRADLHYETRPDAWTSHRAGFAVTVRRRLQRVDVVSFGHIRRRYLMSYDDTAPLSRLSSVEMRGHQGNQALPVVSFSYGATGPAQATHHSGLAGWALDLPGNTLMDVDGDGVADLVHLGQTHTYRRNEITGFAPAAPIPRGAAGAYPTLSQLRLMDVEGRARPAMVTVVGNQWQIEQLETSGWVSLGAWADTANVPLQSSDVAFADIDGDGRTDVIQAVASDLRVRLNEPGRLDATPIGFSPAPGVFPGAPGVFFRDMTGDGLADAVVLSALSADIYPGFGDGTFDARIRIDYPAELANAPASDVRLGDLNSDGVTDFIRVTANEVLWLPMRPDGEFMTEPGGAVRVVALPRPSGAPTTSVVAIADGNGNGSQDVVWSYGGDLWILDLAGPTSAAMLATIDNGIGETTRFSYEASAVMALADELSGAAWAEQLPVSVPVATEVRRELASGEPDRVIALSVRDGFYDAEERRFGGFLTTVETKLGGVPETTLVTERTFLRGVGTDRVLRGKASLETRVDGTGRLFDQRENDWSAFAIAGLPANEPLLRVAALDESRIYAFEGATTPVEIRTSYSYTPEGWLQTTTAHGDVSQAGDEVVTTRTYAPLDPSTWVQQRVTREEIRDGAGQLVRRTRTLYDDGSLGAQPLPEGQAGAGRPRRMEGWLASQSRWVLLEATDYDALWNPSDIYRDGVWRHLTYDSFGAAVVEESLQPSPTRTLSWRVVDFHYGLGKPLQVESPDGVRRKMYYDGLGRITGVALTGHSPHVEYAYDWSAPRPTVETTLFDKPAPTRVQVTGFNSRGEVVYSAARDPKTQKWRVSGQQVYDERGQVALEAEAYLSASLPTTVLPPSHVPATVRDRDALGRETLVTFPEGATRAATYAPLRVVTSRDGLAPLTHHLDGLGRVVRAERTVQGTGLEWAETVWDAAGRVSRIDIQGQALHRFEYDTLGRLTFATDPDSGPRSFEYYDTGRVHRAYNGAGQSVTYAYDGAGRGLSATGSDGTQFVYTYDVGTAAQGHVMGRLSTVSEPSGAVALGYDAHGHVNLRARQIHGVMVTEERQLTASGLLVRSVFDDGFELERDFDAFGQLSSLGGYFKVKTRDAWGRPTKASWLNGVSQTFAWDEAGRLSATELAHNGASLLALGVKRDDLGAPILVTDSDGRGLDHGATYGYDDAGRLESANHAGFKIGYVYDALQNLKKRTVSGPFTLDAAVGTYQYGSAGPRQVTQAGIHSYSWDGAGRVATRDGKIATYDPFDRMRVVVEAGVGHEHHDYGYDGLRTYSLDHSGNETRWFSRDLMIDASGQRHYYLREGEQLVARVTPAKATWQAMHYASGAGPALVTDAKGKVLDERRYSPLGATIDGLFKVDPHGAGNAPVSPVTGLADHGARWMSARLGQWLAPDPPTQEPNERFAAEPWRLHPYQHVLHSPLAYRDPDGREEKPIADWRRTGAQGVGAAGTGLATVDTAMTATSMAAEAAKAPGEFLTLVGELGPLFRGVGFLANGGGLILLGTKAALDPSSITVMDGLGGAANAMVVVGDSVQFTSVVLLGSEGAAATFGLYLSSIGAAFGGGLLVGTLIDMGLSSILPQGSLGAAIYDHVHHKMNWYVQNAPQVLNGFGALGDGGGGDLSTLKTMCEGGNKGACYKFVAGGGKPEEISFQRLPK